MRLGIDLGGTKTELIALAEDGQELLRERIATPQRNYEFILNALTELIARAESQFGKANSIGLGVPGAISAATGLVKNANTICLNGKAFDRDLSLRLGRPVKIANDANCFALSEATDGSAAKADTVFGIILGTGVGGGLVVHGRLLNGANSISGEWGHNPLPWPSVDEVAGPACYCGKHGCLETYLSGPGLQSDHYRRTGLNLSAEEISLRAPRDAQCQESLAVYENRLARGLASVINILDPDVIVVGGGLSNLTTLYENVPKLWTEFVFGDGYVKTKLLRAKYGDSSGVRGAAWL